MGVSGCGKSTVGHCSPSAPSWPVSRRGRSALGGEHRQDGGGHAAHRRRREPWLAEWRRGSPERRAAGESGVVACSALKRAYRDRLRQADPDLRLVYLKSDHGTISARLAQRVGHFFPARLLEAQFADLDEPGPDEHPSLSPLDRSPPRWSTSWRTRPLELDGRARSLGSLRRVSAVWSLRTCTTSGIWAATAPAAGRGSRGNGSTAPTTWAVSRMRIWTTSRVSASAPSSICAGRTRSGLGRIPKFDGVAYHHVSWHTLAVAAFADTAERPVCRRALPRDEPRRRRGDR